MHLQQHARGEALLTQSGLQFDHGQFNKVGRGALHGSINSSPFSRGTARAVGRANFSKPEPATKDRFNIALLTRLHLNGVHVAGHARVPVEIALDVKPRGLAFNIKILGKTKGAHAVNKTKIYDLGIATLFGSNLFAWRSKNFTGGGTVHVFAF